MTTGDIQAEALFRANEATVNASTMTNNMVGLLNNYWPNINANDMQPPAGVPVEGWLIASVPQVGAPSIPTVDGITAPARPTETAFTAPSVGNIPEFLAAEPILNFPDTPSSPMPTAPGAAPEFNAPNTPDKPVFSLPAIPSFEPIALPQTPLVEVPYFEMDAEFGELVEPTERFEYSEKEYESVLLDAAKAKILKDIQEGGYGIDDADEQRLWDRAREREAKNAAAAMDEAARVAAARGFRLPPGVLLSQQEAAQQEYLTKVSSLSRDIAVKRADMYVENRKFALTTAVQIEDMLIRQAASTAERFLNAAKITAEIGIAIFNAQVARYNAKVQAYQGYAAAFESRIRAALSAVEIYKAQIDGARLTVEVQKTHAEIYQTQVNGAMALVTLYKTEMEAAQIAAQIEQLKLQAFKANVEVYSEQVRARAVEFDMFESQIKGEVAKVDAYESTVRAYAARISGFETKARVAETVARTEIAQQSAKTDMYRTDIEKYRAEVAARSENARAVISKYDSQVREYSARVGAMTAGVQATANAAEANSRNYIAYAQMRSENLRAEVEQANRHIQAGLTSNVQASSVWANLASGWTSTISGLSGTFETL
jgi:hypothetical protein